MNSNLSMRSVQISQNKRIRNILCLLLALSILMISSSLVYATSQAVITGLSIDGILEYVEIPDFEYNLTTELKSSSVSFENPYSATVEVKFNNTVLGENTDYWNQYDLDFIDGLNTVEITVTSEDGINTNTYVINIARNCSSQAVITGLSVGGILEYDKIPYFVYDFTTELENSSVSFENPYSATVEVKLNDTTLFSENPGYWNNYEFDFVTGVNTVEINVVSEDGINTNTYRININRINAASQAVITSLSIDGILEYVETPGFEYNLTTELESSSVSFANPYGATVEVKFNNTVLGENTDFWNDYNLDFVTGVNTIEIKVTSEDGENTNIYRININRINAASQALIRGLSIGGVLDYVETPLFEYDNLTTTRKMSSLRFDNPYGATVEVKFNNTVLGENTDFWNDYDLDFVTGVNTVEITVTSEDGENTNIYVINITRNRSSQAVIQGLSIGGVLDYVETPLFEYNIITEFKGGHLGFQNSYGATIEVEFNGVVLGNETDYWLDFVIGVNTVEINVVSEDGENTNIYVINITRNRSSQAVIENLCIDGILEHVEIPVFEYDNLTTTRKKSYLGFKNPYGAAIEVKFNGSTILNEDTDYWHYYRLDFVDGENTIEITVTSEDGEIPISMQ